jgi:hypothetical protein
VAVLDTLHIRSEYVDATSDEALLDSVDPWLVRMTEQLLKKQQLSHQVETAYNQVDTPARCTFVSDERHAKVTA